MSGVEFIDSADVAYMREDMLALMTQTCAIVRPTKTKVKGDYTTTNVPVASGVRCRLMPAMRSGRERGDSDQRSERQSWDVSHMLTLPHDVDVERGDIVAVTGEGSKYVVIGLRLEDAQWRMCIRAEVKATES